ncbi:MAG: hypothetical protein KF869_04730 [Phycisphaeraceae bacterium]|nr:hypothetical protein [Phycisphaeraceae bacterium]
MTDPLIRQLPLPGFVARGLDVRDESVLAAPVAAPKAGTRIVLWSGSLGDDDGPAPRNWTAAACETLDAATARWVDAGLAGELLVRPHARHIVSDIPSAVRFARRWGQTGPHLLWDPAAMLEGPMVAPAHACTHLERLIDALEHPDLARAIEAVALLDGRGPWDSELIAAAKDRCAALGVRVLD